MSSLLRALVFAALVLFTGTWASADTPAVPTFPNLQNDPLYNQETYQKIRDIMVDVSWNQVEIGTAMRDLTLAVINAHPVRGAINFRISSEAPPSFRQQKISLTLKGVPVYQVLEYLSRQVPFTIKVHPDVVLIVPGPAR